jgi:putative transport protein
MAAEPPAKTPKPRSKFSIAIAKLIAIAILVGIPVFVALTSSSMPPEHPQSVGGKVFAFLGTQQFALLFLLVTGGYLLGKLQFAGVGLGSTGATLILSLEVSVWALAGEGIHFEIASFASTMFFNMFMFAVGMKVGPQFMSGMRRNGFKFVVIAVIIPVVSLGLSLALKYGARLPPGMAPGILAGANTATPGLGAAQTAYTSDRLIADPEAVKAALGNLSTSFAFSYSITIVLFVLLMKILPRLFRRDAPAEARAYIESAMGSGAPLPGEADAFLVGTLPVATRSYALEKGEFIGHALGELKRALPLVAVERILRAGRMLALSNDLRLQRGDTVALFGTVPRLVDAAPRFGPEIDAPELRETKRQTVDLVLNKPAAVGKKLGELAQDIGHGVYLNAMFRGGESIPFGTEVIAEKGDVLRVTAGQERIARLEQDAGTVIRPSLGTDIVTLGLGLAAGALLGAISVPAGPIKITLGPSVGLLIIGIALSAFRTRHPELGGPFPEPARKLLEDLGLGVFVAILGLTSGAGVIQAIESGGVLTIVLGALLVGLLPPLLAWIFGLYVLKMNSALLLGAVAGGTASAAGLNAGQEAAASTVPAIAYPVAFAIGNVLLTLFSYGLALLD